MVTFCQTVVYYPNQDSDVDTVCQSYSDLPIFTGAYSCARGDVCVALVTSAVHRWTQDTGILRTQATPSHSPPILDPWQPAICLLFLKLYHFQNPVIQYVTFWDWLSSAWCSSLQANPRYTSVLVLLWLVSSMYCGSRTSALTLVWGGYK